MCKSVPSATCGAVRARSLGQNTVPFQAEIGRGSCKDMLAFFLLFAFLIPPSSCSWDGSFGASRRRLLQFGDLSALEAKVTALEARQVPDISALEARVAALEKMLTALMPNTTYAASPLQPAVQSNFEGASLPAKPQGAAALPVKQLDAATAQPPPPQSFAPQAANQPGSQQPGVTTGEPSAAVRQRIQALNSHSPLQS